MKQLTLFPLIMLMTGAIDSIRNLPATALFGSTLIFFFVLAAVLFLLPVALVSAELSSCSASEGGVFIWVRNALGARWGFLAIWLQWINTMVWYPTMLSFIAATATYLIDPSLAQNKLYLVTVIISVFWILTAINLRGLHTSARVATVCALLGLVLPMALILGFGVLWLVNGKPVHMHLTMANMIPHFAHGDCWVSLTAIIASFLGMELATVHVNHVKDARRQFPRALLVSVTFILLTMVGGSLAIAYVVPSAQLSLVSGVMQIFSDYFHAYHIVWFIPLIALLILFGAFGNMVNWIISPAKGLLQSAREGFLPSALAQENKQGASGVMLIVQALLVTVICLAFLLMPSVNGSYWFLTDLSTELYLLMYALMFIAAIVLKWRHRDVPRAFSIPGGLMGFSVVALLGLIGVCVAMVIGFVPPSGIAVGTSAHYHALFGGGMVLMICPALVIMALHLKRSIKR